MVGASSRRAQGLALLFFMATLLSAVPTTTQAALGSGEGLLRGTLDAAQTHARLGGVWNLDHSGSQVATAGDVNGDGWGDVLVAAPKSRDLYGIAPNAGIVYLVYGPVNGTVSLRDADFIIGGRGEGLEFGASIAGVGDLNADGFDDFVVGAPGHGESGLQYRCKTSTSGGYLPNGPTCQNVVSHSGAYGRVFGFYGSPSLSGVVWSDNADFGVGAGVKGARFGATVAALGDTDGDGLPDYAVGAPNYVTDRDGVDGRVFVYTATRMATITPDGSDERLGWRVASAGDVNGDGLGDLLFSAPYRGSGVVYLHYGPILTRSAGEANGLFTREPSSSSERFGLVLGSARDVDGDGRDEILVGVPDHDRSGLTNAGAAYLVRGPAGGTHDILSASSARIYGTATHMRMGTSVNGFGDLDGDGLGDWGVTYFEASGVTGRNMVRGWYGPTSSGTLSSAPFALRGELGGDAGVFVPLGDINDDGADDLLVGDPLMEGPRDAAGMSYLLKGCKTGQDLDGDRLTDCVEGNVEGTDRFDADTDNDGLQDGDEVLVHDSDPLSVEGDGDGLTDWDEVMVHGTHAGRMDTDGDEMDDGTEILVEHTDPLDPDTDDDGLQDGWEILYTETRPLLPDTDGDGILDGDEDFDGDRLTNAAELAVHGTDARDADSDDDGLLDGEELSHGSSPFVRDTDEDGIEDGPEIFAYGTDPLKKDSDLDALNDLVELFLHGTLPMRFDTDGDGMGDGEEVIVWKTDPKRYDSDDDEMNDRLEIRIFFTDPWDPDSDGDRLLDGEEHLTTKTDPRDADTDGDLFGDAYELERHSDPNNPLSVPYPVIGGGTPLPRVVAQLPGVDLLPPVLK